MLTMIAPADAAKAILDGAFQRGRIAAEILHLCFPDVRGIDAVDPARDRLIEATALPYLTGTEFTDSLVIGIKASVFCGFEERWCELKADAAESGISELDQAALGALDTFSVR